MDGSEGMPFLVYPFPGWMEGLSHVFSGVYHPWMCFLGRQLLLEGGSEKNNKSNADTTQAGARGARGETRPF